MDAHVMMSVTAGAGVLGTMALLLRRGRGFGRLYRDQTYHHQALRALNHTMAGGADIAEVLAVTRHVRAGDADGWYRAWTALGDRNLARARATRDRRSHGEALLRAHTYYLRSEFFLAHDDPRRRDSFDRNRRSFYAGLDALDVGYERIAVPYGDHHLNALYYPAPATAPVRDTLLVFCGGFDSTLEELYFFLVASARSRGYSVLTFEGPGQGSVLREQGLPFVAEWERPTSAVLTAFFAGHPRPARIVNVGLSLGGYLAARAAAFDDRFDGLVCYDVMFDAGAVARRNMPWIGYVLRRLGLERLVEVGAAVRGSLDPGMAWLMENGRRAFGQETAFDIIDTLSRYALTDVATRIRQDVLMFAGEHDQFVPVQQAAQLERALVNARSVTTRVYDELSGGAEHSQLGAPTLWQPELFDWLERTAATATWTESRRRAS
jgi:pimeloyl-ACP methyl ester carboxylesterase